MFTYENIQGRRDSWQQDKWLRQQDALAMNIEHVDSPTRQCISLKIIVGWEKEGTGGELLVLPGEPELEASVPRQKVEVGEEGVFFMCFVKKEWRVVRVMYPVELICNHLESAMFTSKLHFNIYDIWAILSFSTENWANLQIVFFIGTNRDPYN